MREGVGVSIVILRERGDLRSPAVQLVDGVVRRERHCPIEKRVPQRGALFVHVVAPLLRGRAVAGFFTAKVRRDGVRIHVAQDGVRGRDDPIRGVGLVGRLVETCHGVVENFS